MPALHRVFQLQFLHQQALSHRDLLHYVHSEDSSDLGIQKHSVLCFCIESTQYPALVIKNLQHSSLCLQNLQVLLDSEKVHACWNFVEEVVGLNFGLK